MYETEVNGRVESAEQVPADVLARFREFGTMVTDRTVLPWGEHCTECVWPTCYTTCDLYAPRADGKCRRFVHGMVRVETPDTSNPYLLKVTFKQWGKLWTAANVHLVPAERARSLEDRDYRFGQSLYQIALPSRVKKFATWRRYDYKKKHALRQEPSVTRPDAFVVECYHPTETSASLSLTMRSENGSRPVPFQQLFELEPGYNRFVVPFGDIARVLDTASPFNIELIPNATTDGTTLYFGALDFVRGVGISSVAPQPTPPESGPSTTPRRSPAADVALTAPASEKTKKIKCVVWDLDHTLWQGILTEDGAPRLALKPRIAEIIQSLDQRGILQSVASKNNAPEALQVLTDFGLHDYFLCPEISWGPKSEGVKRIAQRLNIGLDTLLFVDDSKFELAEVGGACPEVRVLDAREYLSLPDRPDCNVPVTAEAAERRKLYQMEAVRQTAAEKFGDDYFAFLRDCHLEAHVRPLSPENLQRVHELTQRTNQMNFSGNRYERSVLERVLATSHLDTYVLDCRDRFGEYGVVGFCIVDSREPRITDLMFSCRVQSKRVEHAFLTYVLQQHARNGTAAVYANYRKTSRNAPSGRVFDDMGFETEGVSDGVSSLVFRQGRSVPDDGIVRVVVHKTEAAIAGADRLVNAGVGH